MGAHALQNARADKQRTSAPLLVCSAANGPQAMSMMMGGGVSGGGKSGLPSWPPTPWMAPPYISSGGLGGYGASGQVCGGVDGGTCKGKGGLGGRGLSICVCCEGLSCCRPGREAAWMLHVVG